MLRLRQQIEMLHVGEEECGRNLVPVHWYCYRSLHEGTRNCHQVSVPNFVLALQKTDAETDACSFQPSPKEAEVRSSGSVEDEECTVTLKTTVCVDNEKTDSDMDQSLWQFLPEDLLDRVLVWLPLTSCVRFRSVCKSWRSFMYSQRFLALRSHGPACEPWVLSFRELPPHVHHGSPLKGHVFDPTNNKTFTLDFPFLPQDSVPVAAAGGFVCFCCDANNSIQDVVDRDVSFYVCNPVTKAWTLIPSLCARVSVVTLIADPGSDFYKLVVVCESSSDRWLWMGILDHSAKEYDSKLNRWKAISDVYSGEQFKPGSVFCHGKVHLLSSETVQALDIQQGVWTEFQAPSYSSCANLIECKGRLLIVGDMVHLNVFHLPNVSTYVGIVIWELDPVSECWMEVARMPETIVANFSYSSFSCVVLDELIYIFSKGESIHDVVVYAFSENMWSRTANWNKELPTSVFSFVPRLDACV